MSVAIRKPKDAMECENALLRAVRREEEPMRLRAVVQAGEGMGFPPQLVRRSIWSLIDDHKVILTPENHLTLRERWDRDSHEELA